MTNTKITEEIEENCCVLMEQGKWSQCDKYLKELGFDEEDILIMYEHWENGKSFYPFNGQL